MKKVMAVTVGFLFAFVPAGTAFAGEPGGNAYGNCQNSASGGKAQLEASTLGNASGLGGFKKGDTCELVANASDAPATIVTPLPSFTLS